MKIAGIFSQANHVEKQATKNKQLPISLVIAGVIVVSLGYLAFDMRRLRAYQDKLCALSLVHLPEDLHAGAYRFERRSVVDYLWFPFIGVEKNASMSIDFPQLNNKEVFQIEPKPWLPMILSSSAFHEMNKRVIQVKQSRFEHRQCLLQLQEPLVLFFLEEASLRGISDVNFTVSQLIAMHLFLSLDQKKQLKISQNEREHQVSIRRFQSKIEERLSSISKELQVLRGESFSKTNLENDIAIIKNSFNEFYLIDKASLSSDAQELSDFTPSLTAFLDFFDPKNADFLEKLSSNLASNTNLADLLNAELVKRKDDSETQKKEFVALVKVLANEFLDAIKKLPKNSISSWTLGTSTSLITEKVKSVLQTSNRVSALEDGE